MNHPSQENQPRPWIDAHCHVGRGDHWPDQVRRDWMDPAGLPRSTLDIDENRLLAEMDAAGVSRAAIFAFNAKRHLGAHVPNDFVSEIVRRHPTRFIGYASVDPAQGKDAARELEAAVVHLGLSGLKVS